MLGVVSLQDLGAKAPSRVGAARSALATPRRAALALRDLLAAGARSMRTMIFSPVYNQILELPRFLDELRAVSIPGSEVLLVNNGCTDGSEDLIHTSGYSYIDVSSNRGVGFASIAATDWALERGFDVFVGLASNGKMLPSEISRVLDPVLEGRADYVTGSRFMSGGASPNLPSFRRNAIPMVTRMAELACGVRLTDATCGYRAYRLDIMRRANFDWHASSLGTYGFEYYLYAKVLLDRHLRWLEVPITMRYPPKGQRYSKIRPGRDWWEMIKPWLLARIDGKGFDPA
jgi:glycosyltransferase involved in cell wall biosynthesis